VACQLDYQYPLYDEKISNYVIRQKKKALSQQMVDF